MEKNIKKNVYMYIAESLCYTAQQCNSTTLQKKKTTNFETVRYSGKDKKSKKRRRIGEANVAKSYLLPIW